MTAFHLAGGSAVAQTLTMPERWTKALMYVRPIYNTDTLTVRFMGDVMMHSNQITNARRGASDYDFSSYFSLIEDKIREADLAVANMEFTLAGEPYSGYPCFSAPDILADYLADCGFDIFLAANNHIFDKGTKGAERTVGIYRRMADERGLMFTGLAGNEEELNRNNPLIFRRKGIKLALLNFTYGTNMGLGSHWPRTNYLSSKQQIISALSEAEEEDADITVALPHWGTEYVLTHSSGQEETAEWLADNGADIIIGTHPHVIQDFQTLPVCGMDGAKKVPVAYSLGNAVSNMSAKNTQLELMATLKVVREGNGDIRMLPLEFTYLWCSRPGGYNDSYTVIPVADFVGRRHEWENGWDYDRMMETYRHVSGITGIKDIRQINEQEEHQAGSH